MRCPARESTCCRQGAVAVAGAGRHAAYDACTTLALHVLACPPTHAPSFRVHRLGSRPLLPAGARGGGSRRRGPVAAEGPDRAGAARHPGQGGPQAILDRHAGSKGPLYAALARATALATTGSLSCATGSGRLSGGSARPTMPPRRPKSAAIRRSAGRPQPRSGWPRSTRPSRRCRYSSTVGTRYGPPAWVMARSPGSARSWPAPHRPQASRPPKWPLPSWTPRSTGATWPNSVPRSRRRNSRRRRGWPTPSSPSGRSKRPGGSCGRR